MSGDPKEPAKKRHRMSVVCLNCKARKIKCDRKRPSCTNCIKCNVGDLCRYEPPHWVSKVPQNNLDSTIIESVVNNPNGSSIQDEMLKLKSRLESLERSVASGSDHSLTPDFNGSNLKNEDNDEDTIDFYEHHTTLIIKRSGMEDYKPLSSKSQWRRDHFIALLHSYNYLCVRLKSSRMPKYKDKHLGVELRKEKKKGEKSLDTSIFISLMLLGEEESPYVKHVMNKFVAQKSSKAESIPFVSITNSATPNFKDELKQSIERILPPKKIIKLYMERFYKYVYPFFPYIDKEQFDSLIFDNLLKSADTEFDNGNGKVSLHLGNKFDYIPIVLLLIFLKFGHITLSLNSSNIVDEESQLLLNYPITQEFLTLAQYTLSQFKFLKKTKLVVVQALLYLRLYMTYCPEDGDGADLSQSQIILGLIIQSAYSIGLNRDATNYSQLAEDDVHVNVWRKLWLGILENDRTSSPISGNICIIQNPNTYQFRLPQVLPTFTPIDHSINDEFSKSQRLYQLYSDLSTAVNNVNSPVKVSKVLGILKQMNTYVSINYSLSSLTLLEGSENEDVTNFENVIKLKHQIISSSLTLTVYQHLCLHYETTENYNFDKYTHFMKLSMSEIIESTNSAYNYLTGKYDKYINPNYRFYLNKLIENGTMRCSVSLISIVIRLYHTKDLIFTTLNSDFSYVKIIDILSDSIFGIASGINILHQKYLAINYYQCLKNSLRSKFFLRSLKKEGFKCIRDMISFIAERRGNARCKINEGTNPYNEGKQLKVTYGIEKDPDTTLVNLNNINVFTNYEMHQLQELLEYTKKSIILDDNSISSEQAIWEPSFSTFSLPDAADITPVTTNSIQTPVGFNDQVFNHVNIDASIRSSLPTPNLMSSSNPNQAANPLDTFQFDSANGLVNLDHFLGENEVSYADFFDDFNISNMFEI